MTYIVYSKLSDDSCLTTVKALITGAYTSASDDAIISSLSMFSIVAETIFTSSGIVFIGIGCVFIIGYAFIIVFIGQIYFTNSYSALSRTFCFKTNYSRFIEKIPHRSQSLAANILILIHVGNAGWFYMWIPDGTCLKWSFDTMRPYILTFLCFNLYVTIWTHIYFIMYLCIRKSTNKKEGTTEKKVLDDPKPEKKSKCINCFLCTLGTFAIILYVVAGICGIATFVMYNIFINDLIQKIAWACQIVPALLIMIIFSCARCKVKYPYGMPVGEKEYLDLYNQIVLERKRIE